MTFDPTKPVRTRDGRPARIICTDANIEGHPVVALISGCAAEMVVRYSSAGEYWAGNIDPLDLVNIPKKHVRWVNVWRDPDMVGGFRTGLTFSSEKEAMGAGVGNDATDRIACIRIEFSEGDGL